MAFSSLLKSRLHLNPSKRITPDQALKHPFITTTRLSNEKKKHLCRWGPSVQVCPMYYSDEAHCHPHWNWHGARRWAAFKLFLCTWYLNATATRPVGTEDIRTGKKQSVFQTTGRVCSRERVSMGFISQIISPVHTPPGVVIAPLHNQRRRGSRGPQRI